MSGWPGLFWEAFKRSRNAMVLLDDRRCHVEVNGAYLQLVGYPRSALVGQPIYQIVVDGPLMSAREWRAAIERGQFAGTADLERVDGGRVTVQFAGHPEVVTGRRLILGVAMRTARTGRRFADDPPRHAGSPVLSKRELEVIALISAGATGPEIAQELNLAHNTVRTHARNAMVKLGARSRAQLVAKAVAEGV